MIGIIGFVDDQDYRICGLQDWICELPGLDL